MRKKITIPEIKQTAYQLFKEQGFDEVTVDDISKACGITKPTFYNYIESKEAILTGYYDDICQNIMLHFSRVYQEETYTDQLHRFYEMVIESSEELGPKLIGKMLSLNLLKNTGSFSTRESLTEIVIALIEKGQQAGEFANTRSATQLYNACNFTFLGMEYKWAVTDGTYDWHREFNETADAILQVKK